MTMEANDRAGTLAPEAAIATATAELMSWDGVERYVGERGELAFRYGRRELGHLHGSTAHLPLPKRIRDELIAAGRAHRHPVLPDSGWLGTDMSTRAGLENTLELFRLGYERALAAEARKR